MAPLRSLFQKLGACILLLSMKLVVAITGASGSCYAQRLLQVLHEDPRGPHEVHVALSAHAREVAEAEVGKLAIPAGSRFTATPQCKCRT